MNYGPSSQGTFRSERSPDPRGPRLPSRDPHDARFEGARRDPRLDGPESYDDGDDEDDDRSSPPPIIDVADIRGVSRARDRLLPWFRKIVDSIEEEQDPLRVVLAQRTSQGGPQPITTLEYKMDSPPDETINQLIQLAADDIAEGRFVGNRMTYALMVQLSNGSTELQNFMLEIPRPRGTAFAEPPRAQHFPDVTGTIGHLLDRDLQLTQLAVEGGSRGVDLLERDIDRKTEEIRELKEENRRLRASQFDRDREYQILVDGNMKRQMMMDEHRAKVERDAAIGEGFKAIMPQLLPFILPRSMADSVAPALAMATAAQGAAQAGAAEAEAPTNDTGAGAHAGSARDASPDMPMVPGLVSDTAVIDELIRELEEDQPFFLKLFTLMGENPRCVQLFGMLYESSRIRQQQRTGPRPDRAK